MVVVATGDYCFEHFKKPVIFKKKFLDILNKFIYDYVHIRLKAYLKSLLSYQTIIIRFFCSNILTWIENSDKNRFKSCLNY